MDADFKTVEGDERPFTFPLIEEDGTVVDLTGETILFRMRVIDETAAAIEITGAAVSPATTGIASAVPAGPAGTYHAEFVVGVPGDDRTYPPDRPLLVVIRPRV